MKHKIFITSKGHAGNADRYMFNSQGQLNAISIKEALRTLIKYAAVLEANVSIKEGDVR